MKLIDLERHLRRHGCWFKREGGAHTVWENPSNGAWSAVPRHREVKVYLAERICKQLEIPLP